MSQTFRGVKGERGWIGRSRKTDASCKLHKSNQIRLPIKGLRRIEGVPQGRSQRRDVAHVSADLSPAAQPEMSPTRCRWRSCLAIHRCLWRFATPTHGDAKKRAVGLLAGNGAKMVTLLVLKKVPQVIGEIR